MGLVYCNQHAKNIRDNGDQHDIEGCDWLRFPGLPAEACYSAKGSKVPDQLVRIDNANDRIESDNDESDDNYGLIETDDEDDDGDTEDSDSDSNSQTGKENARKLNQKKKKKGKKKSKGAKRAPKKAETARDRLEKRLAKRPASSSGGTGAKPSGGPTGNTGIRQSTLSTGQPTKKRSLATAAPTRLENDEETKEEPQKEAPKKKKKKGAIKLAGLFNGKGVNWNA